MEVCCTRPHCQHPKNHFPDLDDIQTLKTVPQKFCVNCGMPLILRDRYLPIKLLATGGFGAAFLAIDRDTPRMRQCVVKQFQPSGNLTEDALEKARILFTQEAGVLEEIGNEHQQIPKLFAFFTITVPNLKINKSEQFFYLVQEYISGQTLEEELVEQGNFSELKILKILREILPVLQFIHDKGIIHRDIKPSNIMRHCDGRLFLLDFGAVKLIANTSSSSTGIYSLGFAPPEQMQGSQVFPSTDLYALAVTLITLLTDKEANKLFDAYTNQWQWRSQISINPRLADILDKMLLPAASQRFQSSQEVLEALFPTPSAQTVLPPTQPPNLQPPQPIKSVQPAFATWELLAGAAFSGFEGALIAIALFSLVKNPIITLTVAVVILNGLIFAQTKRWLEKFDLLIIPAVSFAIIFFIPFLRSNIAIEQVIMLAAIAALISITVTTLFRLIYKLMSSIL
ncbi:serine/threonine-protein kinase [Anabaena sp. AL09]|jgi:serine/threonine protein kinase|uniref:serine/threonine-protein kinase n=1 Tax=Anabaena sp. AL09 TaxID=1710891 RepID=UPI0007FF6405|nr:serine/threonine-protein kinase [Anabaena sp. AL09]OBQ04060.1 MAG: serine/threonine protein kinase [Anabaena sp. AL09]